MRHIRDVVKEFVTENASRSLVYFLCFAASQNILDYFFQVTLSVSDLEYLQTVLKMLSFPVIINNVTEIHSINMTTGMSTKLYSVPRSVCWDRS